VVELIKKCIFFLKRRRRKEKKILEKGELEQ